MDLIIENTIQINADSSVVWTYLTQPDLMKEWMGEPEMNIVVSTDWVIGSDIFTKGFHHVSFENKGKVLQFEPYTILQYSHLSSISRLPDSVENYSITSFLLKPSQSQTILTVKLENFPTETIFKHLDFYWKSTLVIIKKLIEESEMPSKNI